MTHGTSLLGMPAPSREYTPGKSTMVGQAVQRSATRAPSAESAPAVEPFDRKLVQRHFGGPAKAQQPEDVQRAATQGTSGASHALPHQAAIQKSFGRHDVTGIKAHTDGAAVGGAKAMGAEAFATGDHVAFAGAPSLHTAAHEAAHVIQQQSGVHLSGGVGAAGDSYEQHADAVADRVVAGKSAEDLLDAGGGGKGAPSGGAVQRLETTINAKVYDVKKEELLGAEAIDHLFTRLGLHLPKQDAEAKPQQEKNISRSRRS